MLRLEPGQPGARAHAFTLPLNYRPLLPAFILYPHKLKLCEALKLRSWVRPGSWSQRIHRLMGRVGSMSLEPQRDQHDTWVKHREQRNPGCLEDTGIITTGPFSHLLHFETILCVWSSAWGTLNKNNCLCRLWINNIMTFPTDLSHEYEWNTIHPLKTFSILRGQRQGLHSYMTSRDVWRVPEVLRWQTPYIGRVLM